MKTLRCVLLFWAVLFTGVAADQPFAGSFSNDELTIKLVTGDAGYEGEFKLAGQTFPLSARSSGNTLRGKFRSSEGSFDFTGVLEENTLTVKTEDTLYKLTRRAINPLAKKANVTPKNDASNDASAVAIPNGPSGVAVWKIYKHPTGMSMSYPPDWQLKPFPQGLQLIPPDAGSNEKGPTEIYLVLAESAAGITTAEDPRVVAYINAQLLQIAPFFQRVGEIEKIRAGAAPGIVVTWDGTNPDGVKVQAQSFSTIMKGYGISVLALGEASRVKSRGGILRGVFASFAAGAGEKDSQLVGAWKFWSYSSSADGKFGSERSRWMSLMADGTALWKARSESSGTLSGRDSLGNETFSGGIAGQSGDADRGTWSAGEGKLYVQWQDGSLGEWSYRVGGMPGNRRLFLQSAGQGKPEEWVQASP